MGGVETWMMALGPVLNSLGHECELFFFEHGPMEEYLPVDCPAHFGSISDLVELVSARGFDVVHANSTDWKEGVFAVRGAGAKLVVTSHGWVVPLWTGAYCDAFVACSRWLAEGQQDTLDIAAQIVLNGIDTSVFRPPIPQASDGPPIVAWVGRGTAVEQKRLDKFAAIVPALHRAGMRIWMVESYGPEEVDKVLPGTASALVPLVEFWGKVPRENMSQFFQKVAASGGCIVSTSQYEGLPLTLLEAQACGCPAIGPDVQGVNECVDPLSGGVLYPFDIAPADLAHIVLQTLQDKPQWQARSAACVRLVREKFSLERMARDYVEIYKRSPYPPCETGRASRPGFGWHPGIGVVI